MSFPRAGAWGLSRSRRGENLSEATNADNAGEGRKNQARQRATGKSRSQKTEVEVRSEESEARSQKPTARNQ